MRILKFMIILTVIQRPILAKAEPAVCEKDELLCGDGSKCIKIIQLCDYSPDCVDSSDETNFALCKRLSITKTQCPDNISLKVRCYYNPQYSYLNSQCMDIDTACSLENKCLDSESYKICQEIANHKLKPNEVVYKKTLDEVPEYANNFHEMVDFISDAFNETMKCNISSCPSFFVNLKGKCYSFFIPAKVTWSEAKLFCESMSSRLVVLDDVHKFKTVIDYIKEKEIKSEFWIGGHLNNENQKFLNSPKKWTWLNKKPVEMGAPFWGLSLVDPTINYVCDQVIKSIRPRNNYTEEMCLAILDDNHYYFSDENCNEKFSPLCLMK